VELDETICSMVASWSPPRMRTWPSNDRPGRVFGLARTVSTDGPPTPKARIIFLKTTGSFLLEQTGWRARQTGVLIRQLSKQYAVTSNELASVGLLSGTAASAP
jgi:hypothetical protein